MARRPKKITKRATEYIEEAASAILQSISLPIGIGFGGFAKYMDAYFPTQQKKVLQDLADCIVEHARSIELVECDLERLRSLTHQTILESWRTSSEEKRTALRNILLNYASGKIATEHELDVFIQLASDLSELQILMLAHALPKGTKQKETEDALNSRFEGVSVDIIRAAYLDLIQRGLIWQPFRNTYRDLRPVPMHLFVLTDLGHRFLDWIRRDE